MKNSVLVGYIKIINTLSSQGCINGEYVKQIGNWLKKRNFNHSNFLLGMKAFFPRSSNLQGEKNVHVYIGACVCMKGILKALNK